MQEGRGITIVCPSKSPPSTVAPARRGRRAPPKCDGPVHRDRRGRRDWHMCVCGSPTRHIHNAHALAACQTLDHKARHTQQKAIEREIECQHRAKHQARRAREIQRTLTAIWRDGRLDREPTAAGREGRLAWRGVPEKKGGCAMSRRCRAGCAATRALRSDMQRGKIQASHRQLCCRHASRARLQRGRPPFFLLPDERAPASARLC